MNNQSSNKKENFRKNAKKIIANSIKNQKYIRNKSTLEKLNLLIKMNNYKNILLYVPLKSEVDTLHLVRKLRGRVNIFVPLMQGVSLKMVEFRLPLFKKAFNVREPKNSFKRVPKIDLAIVPVLGVDGSLKRIGFGKGFYDRFFDSLGYLPVVAFTQIVECYTTEKLCESHDIQADLYITPYKIIIRRGKNDNRIKHSSSSCNNKWGSRVLCI